MPRHVLVFLTSLRAALCIHNKLLQEIFPRTGIHTDTHGYNPINPRQADEKRKTFETPRACGRSLYMRKSTGEWADKKEAFPFYFDSSRADV